MRHPRVDAAGLCYGRHDPALVPGWEAQADAALPRLAEARRIVSSPAVRCLRLARRLAERLGATLEVDARLAEMHFGAWEALRWDAIPRDAFDVWARDPVRLAPPGGERFGALQLRARLAADAAEARAEEEDAPAVIVSHAGPIRALRMAREGLSFREAFDWQTPYAAPIPLPRRTEEDTGPGRPAPAPVRPGS